MDIIWFCGTEIQELDSNMQYLVYENHSKFIKASETIREVSMHTHHGMYMYVHSWHFKTLHVAQHIDIQCILYTDFSSVADER